MGFQVGPLFVRYYGVIVMVGVLAAAWLSALEARRRKLDTDLVWDGLIWVLIGGVIGARIWHLLTPPPSMVEQGITVGYYLTHPLEAINIRAGGLGIPGAVIGGALALYWFTRRRKASFLDWVDVVAPGLALGQAVGRWGNFINQELYGAPTDLPWAIHIDRPFRLPGFENQATFHPLFFYESMWNLLNMVLLLWLARRMEDRLRPGDLFLVYLIVYPVGRFLLEFLRLDAALIAGLNANQTIMALVAVGAAGLLIWRRRREEAAPAPARRRRRSKVR